MGSLFPVKIIRMRINISIRHFYEDLSVFCKTMKWLFEEPTVIPVNLQTDAIRWENNLVAFKEVSHYPNKVPKELHITYTIPSFIKGPINGLTTSKNIQIPIISYSHVISLTLPQNFPANVGHTHIQAISTIWHNNFYFETKQRAHGCVLISGEVDGMAMNIFQQLLWHPDIVWNSNNGPNFTLNTEAFNYAKIYGKQIPYEILKNAMNQKFRTRAD